MNLDQLQRWLQAVITHPGGVVRGADSDAARREIPAATDDLEAIVTRSQALESVERLAIYGTAYYLRLLECLRQIFPAVCFSLGEELFNRLAMAYLQRYPSTSYTLDRLGDDFARYITQTRPAEDEWAEYLIDLAQLEAAINDVFDGPGVEDSATLTAEQVAAIPAERWPEVRLTLAPCVRLLAFRFPVNDLYSRFRNHEPSPPPPPRPNWLALHRIDYRIRRIPLEHWGYELLRTIAAGAPMAAALAAASAVNDNLSAEDLRDAFERWTRQGMFIAVK